MNPYVTRDTQPIEPPAPTPQPTPTKPPTLLAMLGVNNVTLSVLAICATAVYLVSQGVFVGGGNTPVPVVPVPQPINNLSVYFSDEDRPKAAAFYRDSATFLRSVPDYPKDTFQLGEWQRNAINYYQRLTSITAKPGFDMAVKARLQQVLPNDDTVLTSQYRQQTATVFDSIAAELSQ